MLKECPISQRRINARVARSISVFVLIFALLYLFTSQTIYLYLLLIAFTLRLFRLGSFSPLQQISVRTLKWLRIDPRPMDEAPKRFALYLGWGMLIAMTLFSLLGLETITRFLALLLLLFSTLEAAFEFCIGCKIYQWLKAYHLLR